MVSRPTGRTWAARIVPWAIALTCAFGPLAGSAKAGLIEEFQAGVLNGSGQIPNPPESEYDTVAASHPNIAFTYFKVNTGSYPATEYVRVDLPPGLSINPQATPKCTAEGKTLESQCPAASRVGEAEVTVSVPLLGELSARGYVYNMKPPTGAPSEFSFEVTISALLIINETVRTNLIGGLRYYPITSPVSRPGNYGEYFTIEGVSDALGSKLRISKLSFWGEPAKHNGATGEQAFVTLPTSCEGRQTTKLYLRTYETHQSEEAEFTTPVGATGCESVPFNPNITLLPSTTAPDETDQPTVKLEVPQNLEDEKRATANLKEAVVTLPNELTLNPPAALGLETCSESQFNAEGGKSVGCPAKSVIGEAEIVSPVLEEQLKGFLYLGEQRSNEPQSGEMYRLLMFVQNNFGVGIREIGHVAPNPETGRITTTFTELPQLPFSTLTLRFNKSPHPLFANPLGCSTATLTTQLYPYSGNPPATPSSSFTPSPCPATQPFAPAKTVSLSSTQAGKETALKLQITRNDGEGLLSGLELSLPPGLLANLTKVKRCEEPQAASGSCPAESQIGTVSVKAGAGSEPLALSGTVYLTGAFQGAPLGLSVVVPANVGPYHLGNVVARAAVFVNTETGQVRVDTAPLPQIVGGVPLRLREILVEINKPEFLLNPTQCLESAFSGQVLSTSGASTPISVKETFSGCEGLPFAPTLSLSPGQIPIDSPLGLEVGLGLASGSAAIANASLALPEGLTLNPAGAQGLEGCSSAQFEPGEPNKPPSCPAGSEVGAVTIQTPLLASPLSGKVYVASPESSEPQSGKEYHVFIFAQSSEVALGVKLHGEVVANPQTGRLSFRFAKVPPVPVSSFHLSLRSGPRALLASPESCGKAETTTAFEGVNGVKASPTATITVTGNEKGEPCPATQPFAPQSQLAPQTAQAGAFTNLGLNFTTAALEAHIDQLSTTLPEGLIGEIAQLPLCPEAQANAGTCPSSSRIGTATVAVGAGPSPLTLSGPVYFTGPYNQNPFGLSIVVPAIAGPYNLGTVVVRAGIAVNPLTAQITVATNPLPTILGGVPLRLAAIHVELERQGFIVNPTSCGPLSGSATFVSTGSKTATEPLPYQATGCGTLPFNPSFTDEVTVGSSHVEGASLTTTLAYPAEHEANLATVEVTLPPTLPVRLSTLSQACTAQVFNENPSRCPAPSRVGTAEAKTPVLPVPLTGPAYLVANGDAFPALDVILSGDGVTVILRGQTDIHNGISSATFSALPDVPVSSFAISFPRGPYSLIAANGNPCSGPPLIVAMTAHSGAQLNLKVPVHTPSCPTSQNQRSAGSGGSGKLIKRAALKPQRFLPLRHRGRRRIGGTTLVVVASRAATLRIGFVRLLVGHRHGRRCLAHGKGKRCLRRLVVRAKVRHCAKRHCRVVVGPLVLLRKLKPGTNRVPITGLYARRRLPRGSYLLTLVASAGKQRQQLTVRFQIGPRPRIGKRRR